MNAQAVMWVKANVMTSKKRKKGRCERSIKLTNHEVVE